jgi:hypothetical protein
VYYLLKWITERLYTGSFRFIGKLPGRYPYFDMVESFLWSYHPESYADGIAAAGRVSHTRQVKGDGPHKKGYRGPPG